MILPWRRLPLPALLGLPVATDLIVALLRQAQGGNSSGYGPLVVLPLVWVALSMSLIAVVAMCVVTGATFAVPILWVGNPLYPTSAWRAVVLWVVVAAVVGVVVNRAVLGQRRSARLAEERQRQLQRLVATQEAIAASDLPLEQAMGLVAEEAWSLTAADGVVVELPDGEEIVYRAVAGAASDHLGLRLDLRSTISGKAIREATTLLSEDTEVDPRVDRDACRRVGARSLVVVPLLYDGRALGVLKVYSSKTAAFSVDTAQLLTALAQVIGSALSRAELLTRLREHATTDELTGLRNRRSFHEQLDLAIARASRSGEPVTVVALDLDKLKEVNDTRGHAAGDRLLRSAASHWSSLLRPADILARIGGDEFAVILENTDTETAREITARLEALPGGHTASAGIATWNGTEPPDKLIARADIDMYTAKATFRASG